MNKKHKQFADLLLKDSTRNARQAYLQVYPKCKPAASDAASSRLLKNVKVAEYIELHEKKASEKTQVDMEYMAKRLKTYLDANITDYFDVVRGSIKVRDLKKLPKEVVNCIEEISQAKGKTNTIRIKLVNKLGAAQELIKLLGLAKQPDEQEADNRPRVNIILQSYIQNNNKYVNQIIAEAESKVK